MGFYTGYVANRVNVVSFLQGTNVPQLLIVIRSEQIHLDYDPALPRLRHKIFQPSQVSLVPNIQIEFISACRVPGFRAAGPHTTEAVESRSQRVLGDVE